MGILKNYQLVLDNFISISGVRMLKNQIYQKSKAKTKKFVEEEEMAELEAWASEVILNFRRLIVILLPVSDIYTSVSCVRMFKKHICLKSKANG